MARETENKVFWKQRQPFTDAQSKTRGKQNERRALALLQELVAEGVLVRARKASKKQNLRRGIDLIGVAILDLDTQVPVETQIPIQIKSSFPMARDFIRERELYRPDSRITVIVVNDYRPDTIIKETVRRRVAEYAKNGTVFFPPRFWIKVDSKKSAALNFKSVYSDRMEVFTQIVEKSLLWAQRGVYSEQREELKLARINGRS